MASRRETLLRSLEGEQGFERDFTGVHWLVAGCIATLAIMVAMYLVHLRRVGTQGDAFLGDSISASGSLHLRVNTEAYGVEPVGTGQYRGPSTFESASRAAASEYVYQSDGDDEYANQVRAGDTGETTGGESRVSSRAVLEQEMQDIVQS